MNEPSFNHLNIGGPMKFNQSFSILFWLVRKKENKHGQVPIYARVTIDGDRIELSTRRNIEPDYWDTAKEKVSDAYSDASIINDYLAQVRSEIAKHYNMLLSTNDQVTVDMIKNSYTNKKLKAVEKKTFVKYLDQYIKQLEEKVNAGDLSLGRFKKLKVLRGKVIAYMKNKFKTINIMPHDMKLNFIVGFEHFLKTVQNIGHNTASKYVDIPTKGRHDSALKVTIYSGAKVASRIRWCTTKQEQYFQN